MRRLVGGNVMQELDRKAQTEIGFPGIVLMEQAAQAAAAVLRGRYPSAAHYRILCGTGNNGGDGMALARILFAEGADVEVLIAGDPARFSGQMQTQYQIASAIGVRCAFFEEEDPAEKMQACFARLEETGNGLIVDALFGVGLSRPVGGNYQKIIDALADRNGRIPVVALDVPSGISSDDGKIMGTAVRADLTITFGWEKMGLYLYPGRAYAGEVVLKRIGFPEKLLVPEMASGMIYEPSDVETLLPARKPDSNKGDYGKILIIAGSEQMPGAAFLSAYAAYRSGAGLVRLVSPEKNRNVLMSLLPEAVFSLYPDAEDALTEDTAEQIRTFIRDAADVVVFGPGVGLSGRAHAMLSAVLQAASANRKPLIIDADGIRLLRDLLDAGMLKVEDLPEGMILTPHKKELSVILQTTLGEVLADFPAAVHRFRECFPQVILAAKDAATIVDVPQEPWLINTSGNDGMSVGGSGDVLTGLIAGLIGQGLAPGEACRLGVYLHGLSGDAAARLHGKRGMIARDLADGIAEVLR